jgi:hypothetical protein
MLRLSSESESKNKTVPVKRPYYQLRVQADGAGSRLVHRKNVAMVTVRWRAYLNSVY